MEEIVNTNHPIMGINLNQNGEIIMTEVNISGTLSKTEVNIMGTAIKVDNIDSILLDGIDYSQVGTQDKFNWIKLYPSSPEDHKALLKIKEYSKDLESELCMTLVDNNISFGFTFHNNTNTDNFVLGCRSVTVSEQTIPIDWEALYPKNNLV